MQRADLVPLAGMRLEIGLRRFGARLLHGGGTGAVAGEREVGLDRGSRRWRGRARLRRRESARRKNTHEPSRKRRIRPASAISFRCRLMRGWLWPRIWVRSLTFSSPRGEQRQDAKARGLAGGAQARKRVDARQAGWTSDKSTRDLAAASSVRLARVLASPDIKICLYVLGQPRQASQTHRLTFARISCI